MMRRGVSGTSHVPFFHELPRVHPRRKEKLSDMSRFPISSKAHCIARDFFFFFLVSVST